MSRLYDLSWIAGVAPRHGIPVAPASPGASIDTGDPVPALILYPAFFTPCLVSRGTGNERLELILAAPQTQPAITPDQVNRRLVITQGLARERRDPGRVLFPVLSRDLIEVSILPVESDHCTVSIDGRLVGVFHPLWRTCVWGQHWGGQPAAFQRLNAARDGLVEERVSLSDLMVQQWENIRLFRVSIDASVFERAIDAAQLKGGPVFDDGDRFLRRLFVVHGDAFTKDPHSFAISSAYELASRPGSRRVMAHHPVAVFERDRMPVRRIGHLTDLHLNLRQDVLAASDAQVLDSPDLHTDGLSPRLGDKVHRYHHSVGAILSGMGRRRDRPDLLMVGGDLVDHVRNAVVRAGDPPPANAADVWDRVELKPASYRARYTSGADFVAAYSLLRRYSDEYRTPIMGVTGNHDAYVDAYGISPRGNPGIRILGNEGIPADHNLTFLEAILLFGPTFAENSGYGQVRGKLAALAAGSFNFHWEWFDWFHGMFTPFSDTAITSGAQTFVNLGWGNAERMLAVSREFTGQGALGHLPRASDALSDSQVRLVQRPLGSVGAYVNAHFTVASFSESFAESDAKTSEGALALPRIKVEAVAAPMGHAALHEYESVDFGNRELGTFELKRVEFLTRLREPSPRIHVVLTGHSHRSAVYSVVGDVRSGVKARMQVPQGRRWALKGASGTLVVLSDSGGPLPRRNARHEFDAWGSAPPSGSLVVLGTEGRVESVEKIVGHTPTSAPRVAVVMDYLDHRNNEVWEGHVLDIVGPRGYWPRPNRWEPGARAEVIPNLKARWHGADVFISGIEFVARRPRRAGDVRSESTDWLRVRANTHAPLVNWAVDLANIGDLETWLRQVPNSDRFLAVQFGTHATRTTDAVLRDYDWGSWWIFGVDVSASGGGLAGPVTRFRVSRRVASFYDRELRDTGTRITTSRVVVDDPDFMLRRMQEPLKYATCPIPGATGP